MDYEKKYKEALSRAKAYNNVYKDHTMMSYAKGALEYIFPELAESKDERIRKVLLAIINDAKGNGCNTYYAVPINDIIAWLEKQGEQNHCNGEVNDEALQRQFQIWFDKGKCSGLDEVIFHPEDFGLKKQDDQKPADKVEPKFKVGDWITNKGHSYLIADIDTEDGRYLFEIGGYTHEQLNWEGIEDADEHYHLWTIQDAKDGDVLVNNNDIFVFDGILKEKQFPFAYCGIIDGEFGIYNRKSPFTHNVNIYPATKEQRNLLFQKMKEAGYEWDAEKKELRKIDDYCQENCKGFQETGKCFADGECKAKRESEQKSAWSEDDEKMMQLIHKYVKASASNFDYENIQIWFRNIKKKVQPHWKPTEEQMENLEYAINMVDKCCEDSLQSLYNDLKKL